MEAAAAEISDDAIFDQFVWGTEHCARNHVLQDTPKDLGGAAKLLDLPFVQ